MPPLAACCRLTPLVMFAQPEEAMKFIMRNISQGSTLYFLENTPSEIRNRTIASIFKDCKLIEQWGSGFRKIYSDLTGYKNIDLKINEPGLSFQIQFIKKDYIPDQGLNEGLKSLLVVIKKTSWNSGK